MIAARKRRSETEEKRKPRSRQVRFVCWFSVGLPVSRPLLIVLLGKCSISRERQKNSGRDLAAPVRSMDAAALELPDASYENCLVLFLLHEQPRRWRERTLCEVLRVVRPGGKIVIVDYAQPRFWHPLRHLWRPLLAKLEPFALDLWREDIADWLPPHAIVRLRKQRFFGGLYQKLVITR